jgi:hypothetical protein
MKPPEGVNLQKEIERCDREIARIVTEAHAGNTDIDGMLLGLHDWRAEKILIEKEYADSRV